VGDTMTITNAKRKTPAPGDSKIGRAIRAQQRMSLLACRARKRTDEELRREYELAMLETRSKKNGE
jgi:hypothetical protein